MHVQLKLSGLLAVPESYTVHPFSSVVLCAARRVSIPAHKHRACILQLLCSRAPCCRAVCRLKELLWISQSNCLSINSIRTKRQSQLSKLLCRPASYSTVLCSVRGPNPNAEKQWLQTDCVEVQPASVRLPMCKAACGIVVVNALGEAGSQVSAVQKE